MNPHKTTADIYADLQREKNKPLLGLALRTGTIAALETRLAQLRQEAAERRTVESEVLAKFNAREAEPVPIQYLVPTNCDEHIWRGYLVDEWNRSKRML